ncbi:MAG: dTMP kinase [Verrucomicrobia bacterium]|nr:MAG: dTMP kinase [Verrucomicrobiota bacterium]
MLLTTRDSELYRRAMICPIPRGFLIAVEGIDGSGKTTQAERLARYCDEKRLTYILSKEPTSGKYGQLIRNSASRGRLSVEEEIDILLKDRREHVDQVIQPALDQEKVVILDRYYFSTAAYQGAADPEIILSRNEAFAPQPDLLVILDVSPQTGLQRIRERGDEPNKFETLDSLERARAIFNQIDRPYKIGLNGEDLVDMIGSSIMYAFQRAAAEKIAKYDVSPSGVNRMRQLFGGTPILA